MGPYRLRQYGLAAGRGENGTNLAAGEKVKWTGLSKSEWGDGEDGDRVLYRRTWGGRRQARTKDKGTAAELAFSVHNNMSFRLLSPLLRFSTLPLPSLIQIYLIDYSFDTSGPRLLTRTTPSWQVTATSVPARLYNYKPVLVHPKHPEINAYPSVHSPSSIPGAGTHHLLPFVSADRVNVGPHG